MRLLTILGVAVTLSGCARLDHVHISDIDQSQGQLKPISVKISETGVEMAVMAETAAQLARHSAQRQKNFQQIRDILALINMGPRTGNPVFNDTYAENVLKNLYLQCPSGKITAIRNIREAKTYGPVSGEIVRIDADCIL